MSSMFGAKEAIREKEMLAGMGFASYSTSVDQ
jgi:hypothetical protein